MWREGYCGVGPPLPDVQVVRVIVCDIFGAIDGGAGAGHEGSRQSDLGL